MNGWFAIYRKLLDSPEWLAEPFTRAQAWVDLIGLARFEPGSIVVRGVRVRLERGQLGWSAAALAKRWGWSKGKASRVLADLEADGRIVRRPSRVVTVITLTNYGQYQHAGSTNGATDGSTELTRKPYARSPIPDRSPENGSTDGSTYGATETLRQSGGATDGATDGVTDGSTDGSTESTRKPYPYSPIPDRPPDDGSTDGVTDGSTDGSTDGVQKKKLTIKQTTPPTPPIRGEPAAAAGVGGSMESILEELGVAAAKATAARFAEAGGTAADLAAVTAVYRAGLTPQPAAWGPGALKTRLERWRPGADPSDDWPPPNDHHRRAVVSAERGRAVRRQDAATVKRAEERQQQAEARGRLESLRPTLEAMTPDELAAIESEVFPDGEALRLSRRFQATHERQLLARLATRGGLPPPGGLGSFRGAPPGVGVARDRATFTCGDS